MTYVFDIDQTILQSDFYGENYTVLKWNKQLIKIINKLYKEGNTIIIQTARHWDKYQQTVDQLKRVKYHSLVMGNIPADYYINDKGLSPEDFITLYNRVKSN
jgi:hydroxymethylpyrimidine pyrophosphatase-like HAD family hydrolase